MPLMPRRSSRAAPPIPKHPYRDTAIAYGVMAGVLVLIAWLTGGDVVRAALVAFVFFVVATCWSWWRFRTRIRDRAARAAAAAGQSQEGGE
jgi:membrane protein implicated in regulation of membrane protease activity